MPETKNIELNTCQTFVNNIFGEELHQKRQLSLANAALGLLSSGSAFLHKMGAAGLGPVDISHRQPQITTC